MTDGDFIKKLKHLMPKLIRISIMRKQIKRVLKTKFENSDKLLNIRF